MIYRFPIDVDGLKIAAIIAIITIIISIINSNFGWIGAILTVCVLGFFRDPDRVIPQNTENIVISPADGTVQSISECIPPDELGFNGEKVTRISIFMSMMNVHVNRMPVSGVIEKILYVPGKFFNATLDKASVHNEREAFTVRMSNGEKLVFVRIAGLVARRIRCDVKEGDKLEVGQRVGIIRFGSRVDVYLPKGATPNIEEGQTTVAGETIIAKFN